MLIKDTLLNLGHLKQLAGPLTKVMMGTLIIFWSTLLFAKNQRLKIEGLRLSFQVDDTLVPSSFRDRLREDWEEFCETFAEGFVVGKGHQGRGISDRFFCSPVDFSNAARTSAPANEAWQFHFSWTPKGLDVSIFHQETGPNSSRHLLQNLKFPEQITPANLFASAPSKLYVAESIYRILPVAWSIVLKNQQTTLLLAAPEGSATVRSAPKLALYTMAFNSVKKIWVPNLYAIAQATSNEDHAANKETGELGTVLEVRWLKTTKRPKVRLWAQEIFDPREGEKELSALNFRVDRNETLVGGYAQDSLKSNRVTYSYGLHLPSDDEIVHKAPRTSIALDFGRGLLENFSLDYEFSPLAKTKVASETHHYSWSRLQAGHSFRLGVPNLLERFATRLRLTPKIGVSNMNSYYPLLTGGNEEFPAYADFRFTGQLDLGGAFSWELEAHNFRLKASFSTHLSGYVLADADAVSISNQRMGGDISYQVYKISRGLRLDAIAFGYIDWVSIRKKGVVDSSLESENQTTSTGTSYNNQVFGLGFAVPW